jgi:hypothetical protein
MEDEKLEVSEEYKKAYNKADMIVTYMPNVLKGVQMPDKNLSEGDKGFIDRIKEYEKEQEALRTFSVDKLRQDYQKDRGMPDKSKDKGLDRSK